MIYSPDHNFLMLKNLKVGGTSLEVELSKVLPDNAIVTPIIPSNKDHIPRNHDEFYNHMPYTKIKEKIDLSNVKSYVVVRNPYASVLSHFFFVLKIKNIDISNVDKKIDWYFKNHLLPSTHNIYTENNQIVVNKIIYYEKNIENQINSILLEHRIKQIKMKTFEKQYKPKWATYQELFNREQMDLIYHVWRWEFENLGYEVE